VWTKRLTDGRMDGAVPLGRDDRANASRLQIGQDEVGVACLLCERDTGRWPRLIHDRSVAFHIRDLTAAQSDREREADLPAFSGAPEAGASPPESG
jgi:hypothetical protein